MQNGKVQLVFEEKDFTLRFANEGEFFETLGILSREGKEVWIQGEPSYKFLVFEQDGTLLKNPDKEARNVRVMTKSGRKLVSDLDSFRIGNINRKHLINPLLELIGKSKEEDLVKCPVFVKYIIEEFGFDYKLSNDESKAEIRPPRHHEMKNLMEQKNLSQFFDNFVMGYSGLRHDSEYVRD